MKRLLAALVAVFVSSCTLGAEGDIFTTRGTFQVTTTDAGTPCTPELDRANWPVRIVFVVQNSGAMCVVDPPGSQGQPGFCEMIGPGLTPSGQTRPARATVIDSFLNANRARTNFSAALVSWGENPQVVPFVSGADPSLRIAVAELQNTLKRGSNLQGGLEAAKALIEQDVLTTAASVRARSRYVVVVLSTGIPFPRCAANDSMTEYASAARPELVWADSPGAGTWCNGQNPEVLGFTPGSSLNQNAQLFAAVDGMLALDTQYGLGDVRVFTRLLMNDANLAACGPICQDLFGPQSLADSRTMGTWLLTQLAQRGQGTFVDPGAPSNLTLSDLDTSEFTTFCGP
ncbi:MAG: VWA domain-containing protein [Myxococcales bacterium]|nr:VWA domain-containing protein [Myxococcales bacterium]